MGTVVAKKSGGGDKATETTVSFGAMDRNKDGALALSEFKSAMTDGFKSSDKDGDGTLTREEALAAYGDRGGEYFDALDSAKTGSVTMATLEKDAEQAFSWADADGNGSISAAEKSAVTAEHTEAEAEQKANPKMKAAKLARKIR